MPRPGEAVAPRYVQRNRQQLTRPGGRAAASPLRPANQATIDRPGGPALPCPGAVAPCSGAARLTIVASHATLCMSDCGFMGLAADSNPLDRRLLRPA